MVWVHPFESLSTEDQLATGSASVVYNIRDLVVFKTPIKFDTSSSNGPEDDVRNTFLRRQSQVFIDALDSEKRILEFLEADPHPNIVRCIFISNDGIFLEPLKQSIKTYVEATPDIPRSAKARWALEMTSSVAWLEKLGFVHGDIRPENFMLTDALRLKLVDFDCTVTAGEVLYSFNEPYWFDRDDDILNTAGPKPEQFALGSCLYYIYLQHEATIETVGDHQPVFPDLTSVPIASIIQKCWNLEYVSVGQLANATLWKVAKLGHLAVFVKFLYSRSIGFRKSMSTSGKIEPLKRFCQDYLEEQRRYHSIPARAQPIAITRRR